jgi:hypothetical protein
MASASRRAEGTPVANTPDCSFGLNPARILFGFAKSALPLSLRICRRIGSTPDT